jgi:glycosyltransferase involved in cell wall biosynthesis
VKLSVVCPVLNEELNIQAVIDFFIQAAPADKELLLIDGGSSDRTTEVILRNADRFPNVRLLHNVNTIVPFALNLAIPQCKGEYIVRLDGHSKYAPDYFERILEVFDKTGADIVGGPTRTAFRSSTQEAIAFAISHPVGIGGSRVHDEHYEGYSDSVTFGSWRREVFSKIGYFDVRLVRNQDDEFHYRAKSKGLKIYQSPLIKLYYFPRQDYKGLFKQYFQYGLYKPLVLKKIKSETKIRHLVPSLFALYLLIVWIIPLGWFKIIPLIAYILIVMAVAIRSRKTMLVKIKIMAALPVIHVAYGTGFIAGIFKLLKAS